MSELANEVANLGKAERDIVEGESRVTRQQLLVDELREHGESVTRAEELLHSLLSTLVIWRDHRRQILDRIAVLEARH